MLWVTDRGPGREIAELCCVVTAADLAEALVQSFSAGMQGESAGGGGWLLRQQVTGGAPGRASAGGVCGEAGRGCEGEKKAQTAPPPRASHLQFLTLLMCSAA